MCIVRHQERQHLLLCHAGMLSRVPRGFTGDHLQSLAESARADWRQRTAVDQRLDPLHDPGSQDRDVVRDDTDGAVLILVVEPLRVVTAHAHPLLLSQGFEQADELLHAAEFEVAYSPTDPHPIIK
jgi:hypothetical protein